MTRKIRAFFQGDRRSFRAETRGPTKKTYSEDEGTSHDVAENKGQFLESHDINENTDT
jgi:hypothetical protein